MAATPHKSLPSWLEGHPSEAALYQNAITALQEQMLALGAPCSGSTCACQRISSLAQQVCQAAASILQGLAVCRPDTAAATPEEEQQSRLQAQLQLQDMGELRHHLPCLSAQLLAGQHSPDALCSMADAFNRLVAAPVYAARCSGPCLVNFLDPEETAHQAAAQEAGKKALTELWLLETTFICNSQCKELATAWNKFATRLQKAVKAVPSGTTQLSPSQADKLSAWLAKGVEDISQTLLHSRPLFLWAAAACRVMTTGRPLADHTVSRLVLLATQTAAAYMKAAALMGKLEAVGLDAFALSSSSQHSSSNSETSGGSSSSSSSSSSLAAVTAAAIDVLSLVALDFANHVENEMHSGYHYQTRAELEQRLKQQRNQGGGMVVMPPVKPPALLTVRGGEQREPMPRDAWAVYADAGMPMALGPTLLTFYGLQLQQHLAQLQLQRQTVSLAEAEPTAAAGRAAQNSPHASNSCKEAEGLLLLGADKLQGAAAPDAHQQLAAVVAGWHRQLQKYREALGYTEQQLAAAAALLADAGSLGSATDNNSSSSSSAGSSSSSSSDGSGLVSVRDCLRYLAAAAICLSGTPHLTLAAASDGQLNMCVLFDLLPLTPALLLAAAAAAQELLPLQQSLPLVSHFVWWAGSARTDKGLALRTTPAQLAPLKLKAHARLQSQLWAGFDGAAAAVRQPHMKSLEAHVTAGIAGWLAQQLLRVAGTHTAFSGWHGSAAAAAAAAAAWGMYGPALSQCKVLLDGVFEEYWQLTAFCCLKPKPALLTHTAAALQVSEAIMRLQDQAAAGPAEAEAGAGGGQDGSASAQQGDRLNFLAAVMFPITALRGLCQVPPELAKSVCGQQLLQAAVSALLTAIKQQGLRRAGDIVIGDVAACIALASQAFSAVTAPAVVASPGCQGGVQPSSHTQQQNDEQQGQAAPCDAAAPNVSAVEALHLVLQLLARATHLLGTSLMAMCEVDAAAAACWLMEERASLNVARRLQATGQDAAMWVFSAPTTNITGIASAFDLFVGNVRRAVWPRSLLQSGDGVPQLCSVHDTANREAAGSRSSSSRSECSGLLQVMAGHLQRVEECSRLQKVAAHNPAITSKWQLQQQQQQQHNLASGGRGALSGVSPGNLPRSAWHAEHAGDLMTALATNLLAMAGSISATLPSRFCCSNPGCSSLATVSEGHALVRGHACVCGGCQVARYCSGDCQAAHWQVHAGECPILRQCSTGRDCQQVPRTTAAAEQQPT